MLAAFTADDKISAQLSRNIKKSLNLCYLAQGVWLTVPSSPRCIFQPYGTLALMLASSLDYDGRSIHEHLQTHKEDLKISAGEWD